MILSALAVRLRGEWLFLANSCERKAMKTYIIEQQQSGGEWAAIAEYKTESAHAAALLWMTEKRNFNSFRITEKV